MYAPHKQRGPEGPRSTRQAASTQPERFDDSSRQTAARARLRGYAQDRMFADYWRAYEEKFYSSRCCSCCERRAS